MNSRILPWIIIIIWFIEIIYSFDFGRNSNINTAQAKSIFLIAIAYGSLILLTVLTLSFFFKIRLKSFLIAKERPVRTQAVFGLVFGTVLFMFSIFLIGPAIDYLIPSTKNEIDLSKYFNEINYLPIWLFIAIFKGGVVEELWRGFSISQFSKEYGKTGLIMAIILSSAVFGIGHLYQGYDAVVVTTIEGLVLGAIFMLRKSLLELILIHATRDILSIFLGFYLYG